MYISFADGKAKPPKSQIKGIKALQIYARLIYSFAFSIIFLSDSSHTSVVFWVSGILSWLCSHYALWKCTMGWELLKNKVKTDCSSSSRAQAVHGSRTAGSIKASLSSVLRQRGSRAPSIPVVPSHVPNSHPSAEAVCVCVYGGYFLPHLLICVCSSDGATTRLFIKTRLSSKALHKVAAKLGAPVAGKVRFSWGGGFTWFCSGVIFQYKPSQKSCGANTKVKWTVIFGLFVLEFWKEKLKSNKRGHFLKLTMRFQTPSPLKNGAIKLWGD